jgi:hypothetical protein
MANRRPIPPTLPRLGTLPLGNLTTTRLMTDTIPISAIINDPDEGYNGTVRLVVWYADNPQFKNRKQALSTWGPKNRRATATLTGLRRNTRYYVQLRTQDRRWLLSNMTTVGFWTNRFPTPPTILTPITNAQYPERTFIKFTWKHHDPDGDSQRGYHIQYRTKALLDRPPGPIGSAYLPDRTIAQHTFTVDTFRANTYYEFRIRTRDAMGSWGAWTLWQSFFVTGNTAHPLLLSPIKDSAVDVGEVTEFEWKFRDPSFGDQQVKADLQYRAVGTSEWTVHVGTTTTPGTSRFWEFPEGTFAAGVRYEWQMRTYDSSGSLPSDWSPSAYFWGVPTPGSAIELDDVEDVQTEPLGSLGCGNYRVFVYDRGGKVRRGEIKPLASVQWGRKRDDISNAIIHVVGFADDCCELLADLRSWVHEIVIFRDGVRVWEGPVTRITYQTDSVEIEAKDVMAYVYRRIMRQGYNDSYRIVNGRQIGMTTVVDRAGRITMNALATNDPNVLPYLTLLRQPDDARQSRIVADFSKTAWEEVDDLAATAGLDYATVGRRIIYWDTHRAIGRLPEMRDGDFSEPPVVTEYGMQTANVFAVTNNSGVYGLATPAEEDDPGEYYGFIEQIASAYGEATSAPTEALTPTARAQLEVTLAQQARRNILGRWPTPLVVRVPDNASLNPDVTLGINQLIPGVWLPLRSSATCRTVSQWQKLDSITVVSTPTGETIGVVMSPAPNGGQDPDAEDAATEEV